LCPEVELKSKGRAVAIRRCASSVKYLNSAEFYTKDDAIEYAKDVSKFGVDWAAVYRPENYAKSGRYRQTLSKLQVLRDEYEAGGYFKP
jgi:hypothetical protein